MECLLENAKRCFCQDLFATKLSGIKIDEVADNYAKCSMVITPNHLNANCFVMGGAIFTLADFTFAIAANSKNPVTVTLSSTVNFLSPASGSILYAESKCDKITKSVSFYTTTVTDEKGKTVAIASSTGFRKHEADQ
jgi:acyl-CoA thioesterase